MLQDLLVDSFVIEFIIGNLGPIHWLVFADWGMDYCELGIKSHLLHLPFLISEVVLRESFLNVLVGFWELEYLGIKILLLPWNLEGDFRLFNVLS